jgi:hypothetical protein
VAAAIALERALRTSRQHRRTRRTAEGRMSPTRPPLGRSSSATLPPGSRYASIRRSSRESGGGVRGNGWSAYLQGPNGHEWAQALPPRPTSAVPVAAP